MVLLIHSYGAGKRPESYVLVESSLAYMSGKIAFHLHVQKSGTWKLNPPRTMCSASLNLSHPNAAPLAVHAPRTRLQIGSIAIATYWVDRKRPATCTRSHRPGLPPLQPARLKTRQPKQSRESRTKVNWNVVSLYHQQPWDTLFCRTCVIDDVMV